MKPKTLVLGVSLNPKRHSYRTVAALKDEGNAVAAIGPKKGVIDGIPVETGFPELKNIHTVTLYLKPERQEPYIDYILSLKPKRIIFNKKTYNPVLWDAAEKAGVQVVEDCNLVMIAKGIYWGD